MRAAGIVLVLLLAGCSAPAPHPEKDRYPTSIAALGDSISAGTNTARDRIGEDPHVSWAVGDATDDGVTSHYERLVALSPGIAGHLADFARSGARMRDLASQAQEAVAFRAEYVTILLGANDVCGGRNMTSVDAFRDGFRAGAKTLQGLPAGATVLVVGVPNVTALWDRYHDVRSVRQTWSALRVCQPILGEGVNDTQREDARARIDAYNAVLEEEARADGFLFTDAVHDGRIQDEDIGPVDDFHPSLAGQQAIADETWKATPWAQT